MLVNLQLKLITAKLMKIEQLIELLWPISTKLMIIVESALFKEHQMR